ncbi:MAG TPA: major facilitator superfamily domain-containing protein 6 [Anaerolineaceae bacterium]|nr:major facilitator superfamily domain-containing protein 6 [Anaerolineaceae bacterium]
MSPRRWVSLYYFVYFGALATLIPYLNLFYRRLGIPDPLIGILAGLGPLTSIIAGPLWGGLADALHIHRRILPAMILATLPCAAAISVQREFSGLALAGLAFGMCISPVVPLADNAVIQYLGSDRSDYGRLRLWGSIGWALLAWIAGLLIERLGMGAGFVLYIGGMAFCAWVALRLPAPARAVDAPPFWVSLRKLSGSRPWLVFLAAIFLVGISNSALQNFLSLFIKDLGAGESFFGLILALASFSEVPVFFLSSRWLRRFGPRALIAFAMTIYGLRVLTLAAIHQPLWVIPVALLHGLSFSALWTSAVNYAAQLAPPHLGATAQSTLTGVMFGVATAVGAFGGGWLYGQSGPALVFLVSGLAALAGVALFLLGSPGPRAIMSQESA